MKTFTILAIAAALTGCGTFTTPETPRPGPFGHLSPYDKAMQQPNCRAVVNYTAADGASTLAAIKGGHGVEGNPVGFGGIIAANVVLLGWLTDVEDPESQNNTCHAAAAVKAGVVGNNLAVISGASSAGGIGLLAGLLWYFFASEPANVTPAVSAK